MTRFTKRFRPLVAFSMLALSPLSGCGGGNPPPPPDTPELAAVRAVMSESCFERTLRGTSMPNPKGEGKVVLLGNAAYLVKGTSVFAINHAARTCAPGVPVTTEVKPADVLPPV